MSFERIWACPQHQLHALFGTTGLPHRKRATHPLPPPRAGAVPAKIVEVRLEAFGGEGEGAAPHALCAAPGSNPGPPQLTLLALTSEDTLLVSQTTWR